MPPKAAPAARRKGPSFKPPRPVKPAASTAAAKRAPNATAPRPAPAKPSAARSGFHPVTTIVSSDEEQDAEFDDLPSDIDALMEDALDEEPTPPQPVALDLSTPPIPAPLLVRLLHHNFQNENTQIQKGAMNLFGSYMSIFVREAIARAKDERERAGRSGGGAGSRFLQVEDLEKLAPELLLDF
ncbi:uncharacterized protein N0V89_001021 [Didymosphaeria variabile]|uniref:Centromere protein X n=1 Tax=Didymosphaeria variabile TaxID=1932322 RepID=A0A9W8XWB5_9PLEO|nr:uncharacterized protein N0V89_001021 [Didymosphaeria variabile]KAJ4360458.1 hypothetical protein N0V89_001021 [Didymosphaeria variabile]